MSLTLKDRQIARLEELSDLGLAMARAAKAQMCDGETPVTDAKAIDRLFLAYDRATKAVRLCIMLQDKLLNEVRRPEPVTEKKDALRRTMMRIGNRENRRSDHIDRLMQDRLDRDYTGDILNRPFSEIIAMICKDLGLNPDWAELASEGWATDEIESGDVGWPFTGLAQPPDPPTEALPLDGEGSGWGGGTPFQTMAYETVSQPP